MKKLLITATILALPVLGACDGMEATAPTTDDLTPQAAYSVHGGGHPMAVGHVDQEALVDDWDEDYSFTAHVGPDGSVRGEFQMQGSSPTEDKYMIHGNVTCMTILPDGVTARLAGTIERGTPGDGNREPGRGVAWTVVDGGSGKGSVDLATDIVYGFRDGTELIHCEEGIWWMPDRLLPLAAGNVLVKP